MGLGIKPAVRRRPLGTEPQHGLSLVVFIISYCIFDTVHCLRAIGAVVLFLLDRTYGLTAPFIRGTNGAGVSFHVGSRVRPDSARVSVGDS